MQILLVQLNIEEPPMHPCRVCPCCRRALQNCMHEAAYRSQATSLLPYRVCACCG